MASTMHNGPFTSGLLLGLADRYGFDKLDVQMDLHSRTYIVAAIRGPRRLVTRIDAVAMADRPSMIIDIVTKMSKEIEMNADLRYKSIESMDDFMQLVSHERERNYNLQSVTLTPEQTATLEKAAQMGITTPFGGPVRTIMGYEIRIEEQDD